MGTIVLHAGMPKAGSTSVQDWLKAEVESLRELGVLVAEASKSGSTSVHVRPYEMGPRGISSGQFVDEYRSLGRKKVVIDRFLDELEHLADRWPIVVLSAEQLAILLSPRDDQFVKGLQALTGRHKVRVAYYVRPQHTSLVAAWIQAGFRTGSSPSLYFTRQAQRLHYLRTVDEIHLLAPDIDFRVRPFRTDLLHGGSVVPDFAHHILDIAEPEVDEVWSNRGFPLDLVNLLRFAPDALAWQTPDPKKPRRRFDTYTLLKQLRPYIHSWDIPESTSATDGRSVVHRFAYDAFEVENRELIRREGWPTDAFIDEPPVGFSGELEQVDHLWDPGPPSHERTMLFLALRQITKMKPRVAAARNASSTLEPSAEQLDG